MEINEQKRQKFMENASKRVNNVMHNIQILEPMARSNTYDFTKSDVEEMFTAMQETLDSVKEEFYRKFEGRARAEKKAFSFGQSNNVVSDVASAVESASTDIVEDVIENLEQGAAEAEGVEDFTVEA